MSLKARVRAAVDALRGVTPQTAQIARSIVRPHEVSNTMNRYRQYEHAELCARFVGTVKIAGGRNASAVASLPLRVGRRRSGGKMKRWDGRRIQGEELHHIRTACGRVARKSAGVEEEVEEIVDRLHPLRRILDDFNPLSNGGDGLEDTQQWLGLTGNAYWWVGKDKTGEPVELWTLPPQHVRALPDRTRVIGGYVYGRGTEVERAYSTDEIIHFRYRNPRGDPYYGLGDLAACVLEADLSRAFVEFALRMIDNGVQPGLVIKARSLTEPQRAQIEQQLESQRAGVQNAGRSFVFAGDELEVDQIKLGEKEIAFLQSSERVDQVIANCHDMPVSILRLDTAALATAKASIPQWQLMAILPRARRIEDQINQKFVPMFKDDSLFVYFDNAVTEDLDALTEREVKKRMGSGRPLTSLNESRKALSLPAVPGGDDIEERPAPTLGIGGEGGPGATGANGANGRGDKADGGQPAHLPRSADSGAVDATARGVRARSGAGPGDCGCAAKSLTDPTDAYERCVESTARKLIGEGKELGEALTLALRHCDEAWPSGRMVVATDGGGGRGVAGGFGGSGSMSSGGAASAGPSGAKSIRDAVWGAGDCSCCGPFTKDDRFTHGVATTERQLEAALRAWFGGLTGHLSAAASRGETAFDLTAEAPVVHSFESAVGKLIGGVYLNGWNTGAAQMNGHGAAVPVADGLTEWASEYLTRYQDRLTSSVLGTLSERVTRSLAEGVTAGDGISEMRGRVQEAMASISASSAESIARTETGRAFGEARLDAWRASGLKCEKQWDPSVNPCELCQALADLGPIPLDQPFMALGETVAGYVNDYMPVMAGSAHPNDRCQIVAVFE